LCCHPRDAEHARRVVAAALADEGPTVLAGSLEGLRQEGSREFPRAMGFSGPVSIRENVPAELQ